MPLSSHQFTTWVRTTILDVDHVQGKGAWIAVMRFRAFATLTFAVNVAYMVYFWGLLPATGPVGRYNNAIGWVHCICAAGVTVLWVLANHIRQTPSPRPALVQLAQLLLSGWILAFGIALTVMDQWVGSNTTNYVMISLFVGMLALLRPLVATAVFAVAYGVLHQALALTQADPAMLAMARSHSFSGTVMSLAASIVMWRQFATATVLRRQLIESNHNLEKKQQELSYLATHDPLTGLRNRRAFLLEAEHELSRALRYPCETGVLVADLDHFKQINDNHGHPAGDAVLRHFAQLLKAQLRESDIPARLGGEEFIVLLPGTGTEGTAVVAEKIRQALEAAPVVHGGQSIGITVSIGVSCLPAHSACTIEALYGRADQALYVAKTGGRNRVVQLEPPATPRPTT
ncbi:MAG: GGDEF domain-containing protein [Rhodoferax sp.]|nr:MAG: GGDEF domain-containing protein [Rhodoferax sp.]